MRGKCQKESNVITHRISLNNHQAPHGKAECASPYLYIDCIMKLY